MNSSRQVPKIIDAAAPLILGFVTYSVAAVSTFSIPQLQHARLDPLAIALLTSTAGLAVIGLGYGSIIFLGGICSLNLAGLIGKLTKTKQVIRPKEEKHMQPSEGIIRRSHLIYLPFVLFFTSIALGWDIYSVDPSKTLGTKRGMLRFIVHTLNFLATPRHTTGVLFSLTLIPGLITITLISGLAPSIALPYFRRFKVIGINSAPFHSTLLTTVFGAIISLNLLVGLLGLFYNFFWVGAPTSYHYALIVLIGFSLHYSVGTYIGRGKAQSIILRKLGNARYAQKRVVVLDRTLDRNTAATKLVSHLQPQLED